VAFCDIYTKQLERAKGLVPTAATYLDYRRLLDDKSIDAVAIATPQHLHAEHFCASLGAAKHVYQEKTMAFTVDHAKKMRAAFQKDGGKHTVQIGHQSCSSGHMIDVQQWLSDPQKLGKITAIDMHMYRNTPHGKPQWSRTARITPDMNPENILWKSFQGDAPPHDFDPNRYMNWRFFFDYSGGNVYENMCHQLSFWYKALKLQVPKAVTMNGGIYLWKDGREVPDTMTVSVEQPEEMLITWASGFGNNQLGITEDVLGDNGTIQRTNQLHYLPQKMNSPTGTDRQCEGGPARAHAEFLRMRAHGKRAELPVRPRLPRGDRLPHGRRQLSFWPDNALGCEEGRHCLACGPNRWISASHRSSSTFASRFASFAKRKSNLM
jgi:predicted dehydrogenase